jgi:DNA-binding response OmpR family regulator
VDLARHQVTVAGREAKVTPREFDLLEVFARSPGRAFTRAELLERAFETDSEALDRTIDAHVANLRRKLDADAAGPSRIETVFGVGYRLRGKRAG